MFGEAEPEESGSSPLTDRSLCVSVRVCLVCVCVCVCTCQDNCFQGAPECLTLVSPSLQRSPLFALGIVPQRKHPKRCTCDILLENMPVHVGSRARSPTPPHLKCEQASRGTFYYFFFFSLVRHHLPKQCFILCREGGREGVSAKGGAKCFRVVLECEQRTAGQLTSPTRPDPLGELEAGAASPVSPPGRSCHVSRGVPLLSFTLIGWRSGASVRSRCSSSCSSRLHRSSPPQNPLKEVFFQPLCRSTLVYRQIILGAP